MVHRSAHDTRLRLCLPTEAANAGVALSYADGVPKRR